MQRGFGIAKLLLVFIFLTLFIFAISYLFVQNVTYYISKNTFIWMVSTTTQTFGAILGILVTGAVFLQSRIDAVKMQYTQNTRINVWQILYLPSQCMLVLIAVSLFAIMIVDFISDSWRTVLSVFILSYSFLCLALLIRSINSYFTLKLKFKPATHKISNPKSQLPPSE
jgi:hypothetical protein